MYFCGNMHIKSCAETCAKNNLNMCLSENLVEQFHGTEPHEVFMSKLIYTSSQLSSRKVEYKIKTF